MKLQKKAIEHVLMTLGSIETYDYKRSVIDQTIPPDVIEKYPQLGHIITNKTHDFFADNAISEAKEWLKTILEDLK